MTKRTVTNHRFSINSFLSQFRKRKAYLASLEAAYMQQAMELQRLKESLYPGLMRHADLG
jgi:hypothetical protein